MDKPEKVSLLVPREDYDILEAEAEEREIQTKDLILEILKNYTDHKK